MKMLIVRPEDLITQITQDVGRPNADGCIAVPWVAEESDCVVLVLTQSQAQDIVNERRNGGWICSLRGTLEDNIDLWKPLTVWEVCATVTGLYANVSGTIEAHSEDDAREMFIDSVRGGDYDLELVEDYIDADDVALVEVTEEE